MSSLPGLQSIDPFSLKLRGTFGRFKTTASHKLHYITTTLTINELAKLRTASEVFDARDVNFDELMQRDIDSGRVADIATNYLASGRERAIFFPPLLVCVAVQDTNGALKPTYSVDAKPVADGDDRIRTVYDGNAFRVELFVGTPEQSDRIFGDGDQARPFIEWATELAVNPNRATLMVLDGQHRLQALKMLADNADTREIVASIEQPVCVLWLVPQDGSSDKVVTDLRDLFVTVNTEPRRVSGHFILLLRDTSYSAATIRQLADFWKNMQPWSRLHLLEWNTREDESIFRRQREFSITTISIVDEALREGVFGVSGGVWQLARLGDCQAEIAAIDPEFNAKGMRDDRRLSGVDPIVLRQIRKEIVPALDVLLREFRPYKEVEARVAAAVADLERERSQGNGSASNLLMYLSRFIYRPADMRDELARGVWNAFKAKARADERNSIYLLAVFQRGYLLVWMRIARMLAETGVRAVDSARAYVGAMETLVGDLSAGYLDSERVYISGVLFKSGKVNFSPDWARRAWLDIQQATFLRADVRDALIGGLSEETYPDLDRSSLGGKLQALGLQAAQRYAERLHDELTREVRNNLATHFGGELAAGEMRAMRITEPEKFDLKIAEVARGLFDQAVAPLAGVLGVTPSMIEPID